MKKKIILFIILNITGYIFAQMPSEDPNFELIFNEDFSGTSLNRSIWNVYNGEVWVPRFVDKPSTISVWGDMLNITANYVPTSPYKFETASIRASSTPFYLGT